MVQEARTLICDDQVAGKDLVASGAGDVAGDVGNDRLFDRSDDLVKADRGEIAARKIAAEARLAPPNSARRRPRRRAEISDQYIMAMMRPLRKADIE
jgi:hypothetical protein